MTAIPLDEQLLRAAEELAPAHPDDAADLREHAARIAEAWGDPDSVGGLQEAAWKVSEHAARAEMILTRHAPAHA